MTNFALENKRDGFFHVFESIGIWCNGNTTDSGPVILGSSPSIPTTKRLQDAVSFWFHTFSKGFLNTIAIDNAILLQVPTQSFASVIAKLCMCHCKALHQLTQYY